MKTHFWKCTYAYKGFSIRCCFLRAYFILWNQEYNVLFIFCLSHSSVYFSCSVVSDSLWPHELQHARLPCPSPTPGVCSNSCPLSQWCYPTSSSSIIPFSCLQYFPASCSFTFFHKNLIISGFWKLYTKLVYYANCVKNIILAY